MTTFTPGERVLFEVEGELRQGWYAYPFGYHQSCVTLQPPEEWWIGRDGQARPPVYTRGDAEIQRPI